MVISIASWFMLVYQMVYNIHIIYVIDIDTYNIIYIYVYVYIRSRFKLLDPT
jgi:uncharacterized protein YvpB